MVVGQGLTLKKLDRQLAVGASDQQQKERSILELQSGLALFMDQLIELPEDGSLSQTSYSRKQIHTLYNYLAIF